MPSERPKKKDKGHGRKEKGKKGAKTPLNARRPPQNKPRPDSHRPSRRPSKHCQPVKPLEQEEFFHGLLPRNDIEKLINRPGDYLVRLSEPKDDGQRTPILSVCGRDRSHQHIVIHKHGDSKVSLGGGERFESVGDLVRIHQRKGMPVGTLQTLLLNPMPRQDWELRREQVEETRKLGEGAFGEVCEGTLRQEGLPTVRVAIKKHHAGSLKKADIEQIMKEARLLRGYDHPNIVRFYGCCAESEPLLIVMELARGGGLDKYLQTRGATVGLRERRQYCLEAATGLEYLHGKNCIHRDIAARNCLLGDGDVLKISDFGLSREETHYKMDKRKKVPIRWLAPETLVDAAYSHKTDVWSYGILMWEIYANGAEPYPNMTVADVQRELRSGYRMPPPSIMPIDMVDIMQACCLEQPNDRPTFTDVRTQFEHN